MCLCDAIIQYNFKIYSTNSVVAIKSLIFTRFYKETCETNHNGENEFLDFNNRYNKISTFV